MLELAGMNNGAVGKRGMLVVLLEHRYGRCGGTWLESTSNLIRRYCVSRSTLPAVLHVALYVLAVSQRLIYKRRCRVGKQAHPDRLLPSILLTAACRTLRPVDAACLWLWGSMFGFVGRNVPSRELCSKVARSV